MEYNEGILEVNFKDLIKMGFDENIVVYDAAADQGKFTSRLVVMMKVIARRTFYTRLTTLFVCDPTVFGDGVEEQWLGIKTYRIMDWTSILREMGGLLAENDQYLVFGTCENFKVLLGSY